MARSSPVSTRLFADLVANASRDLEPILCDIASSNEVALHLAVFVEPYLSFVLDGSKTVESRFSKRPIAPHGCLSTGDVILLKPSGLPVIGWCRAGAVWNYELDPTCWEEIRDRFAAPLRAHGDFWDTRQGANFATLIQVEDVHTVTPTPINKRDRRGWVVLADRHEPRLM